jgi:hypothetical protein
VGLIVYDVLLTIVLLGVFIVVFERRVERLVSPAIAASAIVTRWLTYG